MKLLAIIFLFSLFAFTAFSQTVKPKPAASKPKSKVSKSKPAASKPKATSSKPKPTASKPKTTSAKPKAKALKPKTTASKPKPAVTVPKKPDEKAEWEKAAAIIESVEKVAALRKFVEKFPKSKKTAEANGLIVNIEAVLGNEKLASGDVAAAAEFFKAATKDAPKPIPDQLFTDTLSKFPANLYFRGARADAFEIAKTLEDKAETNAGQLLSIAAFYLSVENGSEAKRVVENAIKLDAASSAAYQTLGLASRMDFQLDESAAAYAKALELEPDSLSAKRGLAEMKRSLGRADEAAALYREILAKDEANLPAQTGLILSLFDAGKRADAETEMAKSFETNSGNVILLAGAAYWYAAHDDGEKAVELAQKAIASDPRFIWSHIALARGFLNLKNPVDAEKTLLAARRYGNFPTLEYEIASARVAAGYYREAAEELAKSFSVKDGVVHAKLGGRVPRESKNFTELVGFERRASIFTPLAADKPAIDAKLTALLELKQELDSPEPKSEKSVKAAEEFIKGDDRMKVHRQIYAATQLLEKRVALPKVVELAKAAAANVETGLDIPYPSIAVMASELYENRAIADARGQYVNVPDVPRLTLSAILRGQIEDLQGWAKFQMDDLAEAVTRLKRAVSVLPVDSAWWRSSTWRLGSALARAGKDTEALEFYFKSYNSSGPNVIRYGVIEALYKSVNGNTDGLETKIGPNPAPPVSAETVAQKVEPKPTPEIKTDPPPEVPVKIEAIAEVKTEPAPDTVAKEQPKPVEIPAAVPISMPTAVTDAPKPEPTPVATPEEINPPTVPESSPKPTPEATPEVQKTPDEKPKETSSEAKPADATKGLFPPVVITIPLPETGKTTPKEAEVKPEPSPTPAEAKVVEEPKPTPTPTPTPEKKPDDAVVAADGRPRIVEIKPEIKPCKITVSEESITLQNGGGDLAVIVGLEDDGDLDGLTAVSTSPQDVSVRREVIESVKARALFVLRSISSKTGVYQVKFEMPCGKREIVIKVR